MKNFKILKVKINDFRGIDKIETSLYESNVIVGDNETSKSGFASAITWCLNGKNIEDDCNFGIVPIWKKPGEVNPTVELECLIGERPVTLKRVYEAKFTRDRKFSDYAVSTYINGIETGVRKFQEWIRENICDEQAFKIISNPKTFTETPPKLSKETTYQAQRRLLLYILGGKKTDAELAESDSQWESIAEALKRYDNANQYLVFMKKKYADAQKKLNDFDVRISQQERNLSQVDVTESEIEEQVSETKKEAANLNAQNEAHKRSQRTGQADLIKAQIKQATEKKDALLRQYNEDMQVFTRTKAVYQQEADNYKSQCAEGMKQMKVYAEALEKLSKTVVKEVCETCGQKLSKFAIENSQKKLAQRIQNGKQKTAELRESVATLKQKFENAQRKVNGLMEPTYPAQVDALQGEIEALTEQLVSIPEPVDMDGYAESMQSLTERMESLKEKYMILKRNKEVEAEIERIEADRKDCVSELSEAQRNLDLVKRFISFKCESSESAINALFENVKFQLFEQNKSNDDVRETCILRYRGVKYDDLSYSTKIIAGLEVVKAFQKFYNITAPIFIDNAESITGDVETGAQTFFMRVREELCPECSGQSGRRNTDGTWTCQKCGHVWKKELSIVEA